MPLFRGDSLLTEEERLRLALDAAELGSFLWFPDEDRTEADVKMLSLFGLPPDGVLDLATALSTLIHPDDRERYAKSVEKSLDPAGDGKLREEIRIFDENGKIRWLSVNGQVSFTGSPPRPAQMAGVTGDITRRKKAADAEARLGSLVSSSQDAIMTVGLDGHFVTWNEGAERLFGYTNEEAVGQPVSLIVPEDRRAEAEKILQERLDGEPVPPFDTVRRRKDGSLVDISIAVSPIFDASGQLAASSAVLRDITVRKNAEKQKLEAARRTEFLTNLSDSIRPLLDTSEIEAVVARAVGEFFGADRVFYGEISEAGKKLVVSHGYHTPDVDLLFGTYELDPVGPALIELLRSGNTLAIDDVRSEPGFSDDEVEAMLAGDVVSAVGVPLVKDGRWVAVFSIHKKSQHPWTPEDVALVEEAAERTWGAVERASAEQALLRSEEQFRSMANALPTIIWTADSGGKVVFRNQLWYEYGGFDPEAHKPELEAIHPDDLDRCRNAWRKSVEAGTEHEIEARAMRHDGVYRWFLVRAVPQRDKAGNIVQWLGSSTDIDDQKRIEERLRVRELQQRKARRRAELLAEVVTALEDRGGVRVQARQLVDLLVPRVAAFAAVRWTDSGWDDVVAGDSTAPEVLDLRLGATESGRLIVGRQHDVGWPVDEIEFARDIAERAGLLLESARLREEEHTMALRLQRALLPNAAINHPLVSVASRYEAASDVMVVGGDWYDSFELPDGRIALVVGDVVGHGLDAAASMGRMRIALAAMAVDIPTPGELVTKLDEFASGANGAEFATVTYAIFDPARMIIDYASAGHPPMLLVDSKGETQWLDGGRSHPLGYFTGTDRPGASARVEPGSLLVLYSDGLVERRGESISVGMKRLETAARLLNGMSESEACDHLVREMGVASQREDDVVVMCVRVRSEDGVASFRQSIHAEPEELAPLRASLRKWLTATSISPGVRNDLLIAVGEACSNAIEHAYQDRRAGDVEVEVIGPIDGYLEVRVTDFGSWLDKTEVDVERGRGTGIMEALVEQFSRVSDEFGTTVSFRLKTSSGREH